MTRIWVHWPILIVGAVVIAMLLYAPSAHRQEEAAFNQWRDNCIRQGGTVTLYYGGWTTAECKGLKQ